MQGIKNAVTQHSRDVGHCNRGRQCGRTCAGRYHGRTADQRRRFRPVEVRRHGRQEHHCDFRRPRAYRTAESIQVQIAALFRSVEQQINVDGCGPSKFGAMEGKSTTAISGDRARTERQSQFKSKLLRALAKSSSTDTVRIIRLDAERIDDIDTPNKQYTETSFQEMRDATAKALQNAQNAKPAAQQQAPSGAPVDDSQCEWSPAKAELKQTGEHATFAGADASRATITVTQTCTDKTKGTSCDFVFLLDQWLAADIPEIGR